MRVSTSDLQLNSRMQVVVVSGSLVSVMAVHSILIAPLL